MFRFGKTDKDLLDTYTAHSGSIQRMLRGITGNDAVAEELTQEAFIKAWKGLPEFGLRSSLKTWVYQVAINVGRDWLRSHKVRNVDLTDDPDQSKRHEQTEIQEALLELEDGAREILVLFYYEGMKQDEVAEVLKVPSGTIKSRLHSARSKLKERLLMRGFDV